MSVELDKLTDEQRLEPLTRGDGLRLRADIKAHMVSIEQDILAGQQETRRYFRQTLAMIAGAAILAGVVFWAFGEVMRVVVRYIT